MTLSCLLEGNVSVCLSCGVCCAAFRVSFHVSELESEGGCVPDRLAVPEIGSTARLRGTDYVRPRCIARIGVIGQSVSCGIYLERPSPCHEFAPLAEIGQYAEACNRARAGHGLPPLPVV
nr:YkgJ family cysteine cluster protein [Chitinivorax sp. B]